MTRKPDLHLVIPAIVAALGLALVAPALAQEEDLYNCDDLYWQVLIVDDYDPHRLDADNDGTGCDEHPGPPRTLEQALNPEDLPEENAEEAPFPEPTLTDEPAPLPTAVPAGRN